MKKFWLIILLIPIVAFSFKDVPKNHWAYDEVTALAKLGIISGYPDGTFRGNENVTRYQLAVAIYRTIVYLKDLMKKQMKSSYSYSFEKRLQEISDMSSKAYKWSSENSKILMKLKGDVETLYREIENAQNMKILYDEVVSLKTEILEKMMKLDKEYRQKIASLEKRVRGLEERPVNQTKVVKEECDLSDIEENVETLESTIETLKTDLLESVKSIEDRVRVNSGRIDEIIKDLEKLDRRIETVESSMSKFMSIMKTDLKALRADLERVKEEMGNELKEYTRRFSEMRGEFNRVWRDLREASEAITELRKEFDETITKVEERMGEIEKIEELRTGVSSLGRKIEGLEGKLKELESDLSNLRRYVEEMKELEKKLTTLDENVRSIEKGIKDYVNRKFSECPSSTLVNVALILAVISTIASLALLVNSL